MIDSIKIDRDKLMSIVKENRAKHRAVFEEAQVGYRAAAIAELDKMLEEAKSGHKIRRAVQLTEPVDQTKAYDMAIRMLELETRVEIELDNGSFQNLVMDEWGWTRQWSHANSSYGRSLSPSSKSYIASKMSDE